MRTFVFATVLAMALANVAAAKESRAEKKTRGKAETREPLDKEEIRSAIRPRLPEVIACYRSAQNKKPDLQGRVLVEFTISDSGGVDNALVRATDLNEKAIEECIVNKVLGWEFPKPRGGANIVVEYPFHVKPENK